MVLGSWNSLEFLGATMTISVLGNEWMLPPPPWKEGDFPRQVFPVVPPSHSAQYILSDVL